MQTLIVSVLPRTRLSFSALRWSMGARVPGFVDLGWLELGSARLSGSDSGHVAPLCLRTRRKGCRTAGADGYSRIWKRPATRYLMDLDVFAVATKIDVLFHSSRSACVPGAREQPGTAGRLGDEQFDTDARSSMVHSSWIKPPFRG